MILYIALTIAYFALLIYLLAIWARFILDLVQVLVRGWRPKGVLLVLAEAVYTVTDRPLRFTRRIVPPVRAGGVALDFGLSIVMLVVLVLLYVVSWGRQLAGSL